MKKFLLFAAAAALFAACASDELQTQTQQQAAVESDAISFDAYMMRSTTRAGVSGEATLARLQDNTAPDPNPDPLNAAGFGVFAYYTDNFDYTPVYTPNFMYNEQVTYDGSAFGYDVTKYWPNEHGSAATSADQDRVSFFAYLPYVNTDPATGMVINPDTDVPYDASDEALQWGITGMKRNSMQGDPLIQYIASFEEGKSVDLCWGTTGGSDVAWNTNGLTPGQTIKGGYPWLNVRKPTGNADAVGNKVKFTFQHATAQLYVTVKTDNTSGWEDISADDNTKVWVRSIRFTGIAQKAALNLNNPKTVAANKARWIDYYGANELEMGESVTVYDGRKDGSEGLADATAANELITGINPDFIQDEKQLKNGAWLGSSETGYHSGVTSTPTNLFGENDKPVYVIPTGEKVTVEIVYDIETIDSKLPVFLSDGETPGSTIENRISKPITFTNTSSVNTTKLENGKKYTLNLILGMKDVRFDASVNETWDADWSGTGNLPAN